MQNLLQKLQTALSSVEGNILTMSHPDSSKEYYYNQFGLRHKDYKFKDFEDYLMTVFAEGDGATVLDDDFPDAYSDWTEDLSYEDYYRFGTIYGRIKQYEQK
jgi:hypothetical protein